MRRLPLRLTGRGLAVFGVGAGLCVAGWVIREPVLLWPGLFLALLPVIASALLLAASPSFSVHRTPRPAEVPAGGELDVEVWLDQPRAGAPWTLLLTEHLPASFGPPQSFLVPPPGAGGYTTAGYTCRPSRRGRYRLDRLSYASVDPLGLAGRERLVRTPTPIVVTPRVLPLEPADAAASGNAGETAIPHLALSGPDDVLVREYRDRDDVRRIHWPSTARTGTLMVRREEQAWDPVAWIVLDARPAATVADADQRFEWLVTLTASIGVALLNAGFDVNLSSTDATTYASQTQAFGVPHTDLLRHLVDVDQAPGSLTAALEPFANGPQGHLVVAVLAGLTLADARELAQLRDGQHRCWALYVPADGTDPDAVADQRAGVLYLEDRDWGLAALAVGQDPAPAWSDLSASAAGWAR